MRVKLNHVGIINECDVEFVPGINLIVGSSGSGKSTLMRCIYNMALNEFSDSDISFGHNTMKAVIINNGNTIEYTRNIKAKGERFYYTVNGETYVKVGRQSLPAVNETLRIGDINVNGEDVNFNFNLQFSSPFLILGNQATLYNVLTYRSSFDISSINDYYSADIKSNASEVAANVKLKERLEANLESLECQAEQLSPIEKLYGDYIAYKHKVDLCNELTSLFEKLTQVDSISSRLHTLNTLSNNISSALNTANSLNELTNYNAVYKTYSRTNEMISQCSELIDSYNNSLKTIEVLHNSKKLYSLIKQHNDVNNKLVIISNCEQSLNKFSCNESFINDVVKQRLLVTARHKCNNIVNILHNTNDAVITQIDDLIHVNEKLALLNETNTSIKNAKRKCTLVHNKLAKFGVCPLCGNHLEIAEESIDE